MGHYYGKSMSMIAVLFGILFAFFMVLQWIFVFPLWIAALIPLVIIFLQYLFSPLLIGWIYSIDWVDADELARSFPYLYNLVERITGEKGIKFPRFGLIRDGNPNAFCYGWTRNSARLVITTGILDFLDADEQAAVVGHEMGHIVHNDFVVMTVVAAVPVVLYSVFQTLVRARLYGGRRRGRNDDSAAALIIVGLLAYLGYIIGQLITLIISRVREYWADNFSAEQVGDPNTLSTALVKIAYGLAKSADKGSSDRGKRYSKVNAAKALGIFDRKAASVLAFSSLGVSGKFSPDTVTKAAAWDLHNPWARYYEILSTHPLPAKRIKALNKKCKEMDRKPKIDFSRTKDVLEQQGAGKSLADEFLADLFIKGLPGLVFLGILGLSVWWLLDFGGITNGLLVDVLGLRIEMIWAVGLVFVGLGYLIRTRFKYGAGKGFEKATVADLVGQVKVSPIRPVPCTIKGRIIGRGVPGLVFSEDMVVQDETGFITIDYSFGIGLIDKLFAIFKVRRLVNRECKVQGWYRRAPIPYVQIDRMWVDGNRYRNFRKAGAYVWAFIVIGIGFVLLFFVAGYASLLGFGI